MTIAITGQMYLLVGLLVKLKHDWPHYFCSYFYIIWFPGTAFAYFAYRQYYPSLAAQYSQKPFPPRFNSPSDLFTHENQTNDLEAAAVETGDPDYAECTYTDSIDSSSGLIDL